MQYIAADIACTMKKLYRSAYHRLINKFLELKGEGKKRKVPKVGAVYSSVKRETRRDEKRKNQILQRWHTSGIEFLLEEAQSSAMRIA